MNALEQAIEEIVERKVSEALARLGGFKRPADFRTDRMSVAEAAKASGVSAGTIRRLESGDYRNARDQDQTCSKLARVYGCDEREYLAAVRKQHQLCRKK